MSFQQNARQLGLGKLALRLWHQPIGRIRDSLRNGGPWAERATELQRREMEASAAALPPLTFPRENNPPLTLHLLTGRRFWYQTALCLHSFARKAGANVQAEIYDDGSLDKVHRDQLVRLGLPLRFHSPGA